MNRLPVGPASKPTSISDGQRGFEAVYKYDDMLSSGEYHCHDYYEFYIHIHGGQYYGMGEKLYQLKPNHLFIVQPYTMHGLSFESALKGYERAFLNISMNVLRVLGFGLIDLDQFFRSYTTLGYNTFQLNPSEAEMCVGCIRRIQQLELSGDELKTYRGCNELARFMDTLCSCMHKSRAITDTTASGTVIQEVLTYINSNYTQPIKIDALAKRFGVSVSYLSREFARLTHRSVYDYILYCRVTLAKQLMRSEMSLNAIAYQCGVNDYSNFLRIFNKLEGVSPSYYRRRILSKE